MPMMVMVGNRDELGSSNEAKIKVIRVAGGGSNVKNCMLESKMQGMEFSIVNTDAHALSNTVYLTYLQPNSGQLHVAILYISGGNHFKNTLTILKGTTSNT